MAGLLCRVNDTFVVQAVRFEDLERLVQKHIDDVERQKGLRGESLCAALLLFPILVYVYSVPCAAMRLHICCASLSVRVVRQPSPLRCLRMANKVKQLHLAIIGIRHLPFWIVFWVGMGAPLSSVLLSVTPGLFIFTSSACRVS